jgi:hypothetical protein
VLTPPGALVAPGRIGRLDGVLRRASDRADITLVGMSMRSDQGWSLPCLARGDVIVQIANTRASITAELAGAGFVDIRARYWNALLLPLMILQRKVLSRREGAASDVGAFPAWLDALLFAATRLEARLMRLGLNFPVGGSLIVTATRP